MSHPGQGLLQVSFRGRNDDGGEISATPIAAINESWEQRPDRNFRYRIMVERLLAGGFSSDWFLAYSHNGAAFVEISSSSPVVRATFSDFYTDGIDCTQQLGSGPFISDNNGMTEGTGQSSDSVTFTGGTQEAEAEWCLEIVGDDVNDRDSIVVRGTLLFGVSYARGYLEEADITVDKPHTIRRTIIIE